jgi:protein gp37
MKDAHAKIIFRVTSHTSEEEKIGGCDLLVEGCENCLINALAYTMATNERFRHLINKVGVRANNIRRQNNQQGI